MDSLLALLSLISLGAAQPMVTLGPATITVNEGAILTVTCTGDVAAPAAGVTVALTVAVGTTAEDGYDADNIANFQCVIPPLASAGSVNIQISTDDVMDNDMYVIHGTVGAPATLTAQMVTATITDVPGAGTLVKAVVEQPVYEVSEADGNIGVVVKFEDINGNPIPIEADATLGFTFVGDTATGGTTGAAPDDYGNTPAAANNLIAGTGGVGLLSVTVMIPVVEDTVIENAERFSFTLMPVAGLDVDTAMVHTVTINDNDLPWFSVLNDHAALPRRSKVTVEQVVFTGGANNGITLAMGPRQADTRVRNLNNAPAGVNVKRYRVPRPDTLPKQRITEFVFSAMETIGANTYPHVAISHISATNHKGDKAPINSCVGSTITAYPAVFPSNGMLGESVTISVASKNLRDTIGLRWDYYRTTFSGTRLEENNGLNSLTITAETGAGLYVISRLKRGQRGWEQHVRVILSDCPKGMYHMTPGLCDGGPIVCQHGGILDTTNGVCTCPPGYTGRLCQYPTRQGKFGPNSQYDVADFFEKSKGRGITYSFNHPFGNTCDAGYYGVGCDKMCKKGRFGPGCLFECKCIDDHCTPTGECPNGCRGGAAGPTCQN